MSISLHFSGEIEWQDSSYVSFFLNFHFDTTSNVILLKPLSTIKQGPVVRGKIWTVYIELCTRNLIDTDSWYAFWQKEEEITFFHEVLIRDHFQSIMLFLGVWTETSERRGFPLSLWPTVKLLKGIHFINKQAE